MKFLALVPFFLAFTSTFVSASSLTRRSHNDVIQARQAKVRRHGFVDTCASLDVDLVLPTIIRDGHALSVGRLDVSLCVSIVAEFVRINKIAQLAVMLLGEKEVIEIITTTIKKTGTYVTCTIPDHAHSTCKHEDLCAFECIDGFQPYTNPGDDKPSDCICSAPLSECNGKCGNFPNGCGSAAPQRRNARRSPLPSCPAGQSICGVPGGKGVECVDTQSDKESCGACATPSPLTIATQVVGKDCTALPNVDHVECHVGKCHVHSCKLGFGVTPEQDGCALIDQTAANAAAVKRNISDELAANNNFINLKNLQKAGEGAGLTYASAA
ncbi:unnamed protein product [Somion occarium]|uniref:Protein CPL1-like domain-containing protein n=1 Tax=Somion occarium TaxID=3059160 RepID=A0ABP1DW91_9APHY